jgi:ankyrin repeat protein
MRNTKKTLKRRPTRKPRKSRKQKGSGTFNSSPATQIPVFHPFRFAPGVNPGIEYTPLQMAVKRDDINEVKKILATGADITERNSDGYNALDIAIFRNNHQMIQVLRDAWIKMF